MGGVLFVQEHIVAFQARYQNTEIRVVAALWLGSNSFDALD